MFVYRVIRLLIPISNYFQILDKGLLEIFGLKDIGNGQCWSAITPHRRFSISEASDMHIEVTRLVSSLIQCETEGSSRGNFAEILSHS